MIKYLRLNIASESDAIRDDFRENGIEIPFWIDKQLDIICKSIQHFYYSSSEIFLVYLTDRQALVIPARSDCEKWSFKQSDLDSIFQNALILTKKPTSLEEKLEGQLFRND